MAHGIVPAAGLEAAAPVELAAPPMEPASASEREVLAQVG